MLAEATVLALAAGAALYVARPLFSSPPLPDTPNAGDRSVEDRKMGIYESLRDLEYDREMQKISADDYTQLRQQLTNEALALLSRLDSQPRSTASEEIDLLEEEIARYRAKPRAPEGTGPSIPCPRCNHSQPQENRFCGHCGARLGFTRAEDTDAQ
ncbi:MAG: hypothetical protein ACE5HL_08810 [Terriglobia bacterium]